MTLYDLRISSLFFIQIPLIHFIHRSPYPVSDFKCVTNHLRETRLDFDDMRYVFVQDTYDGYAESISNIMSKGNVKFIKPDIVAVLNCGFIFYSS